MQSSLCTPFPLCICRVVWAHSNAKMQAVQSIDFKHFVAARSTRESKFYDIPAFLKDDGEFGGKVKLLRSLADYGPATKFVPIIQELKEQKLEDARVIVVDDDQNYPRELVAEYDR